MPKVSKNKIAEDVFLKMSNNLIKTIAELSNTKATENFLATLLTPSEHVMLAKRFAIAVMLDRGYSFKKISETLRVSEGTISSVRERIDRGGRGYQTIMERFIQKKSSKAFLDFLEELLTVGGIMPPMSGPGRWSGIPALEDYRHLSKDKKRK